ncbi:type IV pilus biogenesis protein PilM [Roseimaritima ulvae]|uniref:Competence protein A n=1 Tax=Roseimaritima ulvae TaxID=980254 RepID=A0A5B9QZH0_9BACT|nr:hypothetical protein [Roseimaritima ulvae]QEG43482.1 Competence protein A [Roseimaritima ulvae]
MKSGPAMQTMQTSPATRPASPRSWNLRPAGYGYIGIDIGFHAIQIAQLAQRHGRPRPTAQWQLPLAPEHRPADADGLRATMQYLRSEWPELRKMFRGNRVALTLPMHLTPLRTLEIPTGTEAEMQTMIREELCDERGTKGPFTFASWEAHRGENDLATITAVAVDNEISQVVYSQLLLCGLECHVLDCRPCVLARALVHRTLGPDGDASSVPCAILDFGGQSSQLYFCRDGQPRFCRTLSDSALLPVHRHLQTRLQLSMLESELLLSEVGLAELHTSGTLAPTIGPLIAPAIDHLAEEVQRTLNYTSSQYADQHPERLWVFGAGAEIRDLAPYLAAQLAIDVELWQPASAATAALGHPAVFATAASLSATPLEGSSCK